MPVSVGTGLNNCYMRKRFKLLKDKKFCCLRAVAFFSIQEASLEKVRRPWSVVFIVTRKIRVPKKIEQTREILSNLIQWKV